ncbi:MAG: tetratricopeptide repeat protein [Syntrophomonadaceae bacterium]|nr:tetratricopeptide repeat protein [Syntrophomonadaceae bacterium]
MKYCGQCGQQLPEEDLFCNQCGQKQAAAGAPKSASGENKTKGRSGLSPHIKQPAAGPGPGGSEPLAPASRPESPAYAGMGLKAKLAAGFILVLLFVSGSFWGWQNYGSTEARVNAKLELAIKYLNENDYEKAILAFNEAIQIDPRNVEARAGLAQAYIGIGDFEKAEEAVTNAMNTGTLSPEQYQKLIEAYIKQGWYEEAEKLLARAKAQYNGNELLKQIEQLLVQEKAAAEAARQQTAAEPVPAPEEAPPAPANNEQPRTRTAPQQPDSGSVSRIY